MWKGRNLRNCSFCHDGSAEFGASGEKRRWARVISLESLHPCTVALFVLEFLVCGESYGVRGSDKNGYAHVQSETEKGLSAAAVEAYRMNRTEFGDSQEVGDLGD